MKSVWERHRTKMRRVEAGRGEKKEDDHRIRVKAREENTWTRTKGRGGERAGGK